MTNAGTKVGVAVLRPLGGAATPPKPMALTIHKACAGRGQDDDREEDPAVDPGPAFLR